MFTSKRTLIQKRREMLPGQSAGAQPGARNWDSGAIQMAWNVETRSPDLKSMARILTQALRLHAAQTDSRSAQPDLVRAGQAR